MKEILNTLEIPNIDGENISVMNIIKRSRPCFYDAIYFGEIGSRLELGLCNNKFTHFNKIKKKTNYKFREMIFFDDDTWGGYPNTFNARVFGVLGIPTHLEDLKKRINEKPNRKKGVSLEVLNTGIELWNIKYDLIKILSKQFVYQLSEEMHGKLCNFVYWYNIKYNIGLELDKRELQETLNFLQSLNNEELNRYLRNHFTDLF